MPVGKAVGLCTGGRARALGFCAAIGMMQAPCSQQTVCRPLSLAVGHNLRLRIGVRDVRNSFVSTRPKRLASENYLNYTRLPVDRVQPCLVVMLARRFRPGRGVLGAAVGGRGMSQI